MKTEQTIQIEQLPIGDLRPDPANPRRISDQELETLTRSISDKSLSIPRFIFNPGPIFYREFATSLQSSR